MRYIFYFILLSICNICIGCIGQKAVTNSGQQGNTAHSNNAASVQTQVDNTQEKNQLESSSSTATQSTGAETPLSK